MLSILNILILFFLLIPKKFNSSWYSFKIFVCSVKEILSSIHLGSSKRVNDYLESKGLPVLRAGVSGIEFLKRPEIHYENVYDLVPEVRDIELDYIGIAQLEISVKFEGYISREEKEANSFSKFEEYKLPDDIDYLSMHGLALEARQKLDKIRPSTVGQAGRISGINPTDISVLILNLKRLNKWNF